MSDQLNDIYKATLSVKDFDKLSKFIYTEFGIKMPKVKQVMLQSRLQKRLRALNMYSFNEYVNYLFSAKGLNEEVIHMIDVVSTNKTDFFREPIHFDFLTETILPTYKTDLNGTGKLKIWSAGCSSGEEPYTMAICLSEYRHYHPRFDFEVFASDISSSILQKAVNAIYKEERVAEIPISIKKRYFLKSKDSNSKLVRVNPELRKKVRFQRINLMDKSYPVYEKFDMVFCRNVLIYFERETQEEVINKLCNHLKPGGYFFLGHSESITNINVPLEQIRPTIFRKK